MIAMLLAAVLNCGSAANQVDLDICAQNDQIRADAAERAAVLAGPARARATEALWQTERKETCEYYYQSYAGGSIAPMLYSQCLANSARGRTRDLRGLRVGFTVTHPERAIAEQDRVYGLLELQLDARNRGLLATSQDAWLRYRDALCGGNLACLGQASATRTQELEDSWLAERFW